MELNEQQKAAAEYNGVAQNLLVIAGAGCGKTRTIIARAAHLVKSGLNPSRILMLTFTNRAAKEMKERLSNDIGAAVHAINAGTFHSFCLKIMRKKMNKFNIKGLNIIDTDDQVSLLNIIRGKIIPKSEKKLNKRIPASKSLLNYYSYSRNTCVDFADYLYQMNISDDENDIGIMTKIISEYKKTKKDRAYLDYDDLLEIFAKMLQKDKKLCSAVCSLFDEVLVDEMQDTNPLQFSILKFFADNSVRLFCVGDPAQSIYKFRGAEFKHIYDFQNRLPDSEILNLSLNYRSSQEILDFANWLLDNSFYDYSNKLESFKGSNDRKITIADFRNKYDEAKWIVNYIINEKNHSDKQYRDFMILVRSAFSAKSIEAELIQNEIPYKFVGGLSFAKTAHIRDVLSLIRVVSAKFDELAWMRYLQLWQGIGPAKAGKIIDMILSAPDKTPLEILESFFGAVHPLIDSYKSCLDNVENVSLCIYKAVESLLPVLKDRYEKWNYRKNDLELLCSVAENYESLHHLIEAFTLDPITQSQLKQKSDESEVTLITVHSAKGTEADVCFIAQANPGVYPHIKSCGDLSSEEEERRILYVAITRAENELFITRTEEDVSFYYDLPAIGEDYFLNNLPENMVEFSEPECYCELSDYDKFDNQF